MVYREKGRFGRVFRKFVVACAYDGDLGTAEEFRGDSEKSGQNRSRLGIMWIDEFRSLTEVVLYGTHGTGNGTCVCVSPLVRGGAVAESEM